MAAIFIASVMKNELTTFINKLPTNGTMKNALGEGPYFAVRVDIFAIAVGTAPNPKPQCPDVIIAAS